MLRLVFQPSMRREYIDHEDRVDPALPGGYVGEVGYPQLIRPVGTEDTADVIVRARGFAVRHRGSHLLAATNPLQSKLLHQAFHRATGHSDSFAMQLSPYLLGSIGNPLVGQSSRM